MDYRNSAPGAFQISEFLNYISERPKSFLNLGRSLFFSTILILISFGCSENEIEQSSPPTPPEEKAESIPTTIHITPESAVLGSWGETINFAAQVKDQFGNQISASRLVWSSSDTTIARVGVTGLVTSFKPGDVKIKVVLNSLYAEAPVEIRLQMNDLCRQPAGAPGRGAVAGLPTFTRIENAFDVQPPRYGMTMVAPGDFSGSGFQDLIIMSSSFPPATRGGEVFYWRNLGSRYIDATEEMLGSSTVIADHPRQMEIADLNGDGTPDLFVAQTGYDTDPFDGAPDLLFLSQGGQMPEVGSTNLQPYEKNSYSHASASGDIDCDGDIDLFSGSGGGMHGVQTHHLYVNNGAGKFFAEDNRLPADIKPPGLRFVSSTFCDLDNDGDQDLYLGGNENNGDVVLLNDGYGNFRHAPMDMFQPSRYGNKGHTVDVRCVDINGNGMMDMIINEANEDYHWESTARGGFNIWINKGNLIFENVTADAVPNEVVNDWIWWTAPVDFNADGWPDIFAKSNAGRDMIYINQGNGRFISMAAPGAYLSWVDMNDDGKTDLFWPGGTGPNGEQYMPVIFVAK